MIGHERQQLGAFYAYPEHRSRWSRLLWRLGFDPLSRQERINQMRVEIVDWKRWLSEAEAQR